MQHAPQSTLAPSTSGPRGNEYPNVCHLAALPVRASCHYAARPDASCCSRVISAAPLRPRSRRCVTRIPIQFQLRPLLHDREAQCAQFDNNAESFYFCDAVHSFAICRLTRRLDLCSATNLRTMTHNAQQMSRLTSELECAFSISPARQYRGVGMPLRYLQPLSSNIIALFTELRNIVSNTCANTQRSCLTLRLSYG